MNSKCRALSVTTWRQYTRNLENFFSLHASKVRFSMSAFQNESCAFFARLKRCTYHFVDRLAIFPMSHPVNKWNRVRVFHISTHAIVKRKPTARNLYHHFLKKKNLPYTIGIKVKLCYSCVYRILTLPPLNRNILLLVLMRKSCNIDDLYKHYATNNFFFFV
mgnify:CR=1 FL=1